MNNSLLVAFCLVLATATSCTDKRRIPIPDRYMESLILDAECASERCDVELKFPAKYKLAPDAPHKILANNNIRVQREGNRIHFTEQRSDENAIVEIYYCESEEAAICAFRPLVIEFVDNGQKSIVVNIPSP